MMKVVMLRYQQWFGAPVSRECHWEREEQESCCWQPLSARENLGGGEVQPRRLMLLED